MRNKSVAVLDIRSSEVCAAVGEKGVNNTFIIKSKYAVAYDGYADGELIDVNSFTSAVEEVVKSTLSAAGERFTRFYVNIPGEFLKLSITENAISFASPQKIKNSHINALMQISQPAEDSAFSVVYSNPVYFILSDKRRVVDPVGCRSDSLRAKISWFLCNDAFAECVRRAFMGVGHVSLRFLPSALVLTSYLLDEQVRDGYAALLDMGYISSTYTIACGAGVVYSQSFSVGTGHIAALLMDELNIPFEVASQFLTRVNLNAKERLTSIQEIKYGGNVYSFSTAALRDIIREGLDGLCEMIEECRQSFAEKDMSSKTLYVTGEGIKAIRGAAEHLSNRLVCAVEVVSPGVPYYDKPKFSSLFSLLNAAVNQL